MKDSEFKFRGVWLPADILRLLESGHLNTRAVMLLAIVDALVTSPTEGCWASNAYLGNRVGASAETVRRMLADLEARGLLTRVMSDNNRRREMWTAWSRPVQVGMHKTVGVPPQNCGAYNNTITTNTTAGGVGESDLFFPDANHTTKGKQPTPQDIEAATALRDIVQAKLPGRQARISTWAREFMRLRKEVGTDRLDAVLAWYQTGCGKTYTPQAWAATSFRKKFAALEAAMQRDIGPQLDISEDAQKIAERLEHLNWPKGSQKDLPATIQLCLDRYTALTTALDRYVKNPPSTRSRYNLARFADHLQRQLPARVNFVEQWMTDACQRVQGWDAWSGDLTGLAFDVDGKKFGGTCRGWATAYAGRPEVWDLLKESMEKHEAEAKK